MNRAGVVTYVLGDHLGSTAITVSDSGAKASELRYKPYGEVRYSGLPNGTGTDYRFTGQRQLAGLGLYQMGARWVDPSLGRWLSADTLVPAPANPQSLNRYSYVKNSPVRFVDPTGYFEEDQLKDWYGDDWRSLFDAIWQDLLLMAEFGDVILYGNDLAAMFVQADGGGMTMWSMSKQNEYSGRGEISFLDSVANSDLIGLYRSSLANGENGPSQGHVEHQYATDGRFRTFARKMAWNPNAAASITLGYEWYRSAETNQNIAMRTKFCGFRVGIGDLWDAGKDVAFYYGAREAIKLGVKQGFKELAVALGGTISGPLAITIGAYEAYSWTRWDTGFSLNSSGLGLPPIVPAPSP